MANWDPFSAAFIGCVLAGIAAWAVALVASWLLPREIRGFRPKMVAGLWAAAVNPSSPYRWRARVCGLAYVAFVLAWVSALVVYQHVAKA
ncbi:hypothetical protein PAGU2638_28620 [Lysobacter sp. PAGU 2638]